MEQWQKNFFGMLETLTGEAERFFLGFTEMVDTLFEISEEITDQVQTSIVSEIDQYLSDLAEPLLEVYWELEEVVGDMDQPFPYGVEPTPEEHPACIGCRHYHGQVYGGNLLVCGMHPYGVEAETCPDWQLGE
ncbi:MAG: hypothetical protein JOZ78_00560 [Chroococcidiopsidaceae cyanobacterium CP_BM_ER_R8_30]|nr:hypothetical protein [Chroococcidiopsidaceae cyanobacterium CP_BM_ER_R8_30]